MNKSDFRPLLDQEIASAIDQKRNLPPEEQDTFAMSVKLVGQDGEIAILPIRWADEDEKQWMMSAASATAKAVKAAALLITSDVRYLDIGAFCAHFQIAEPHTQEDLPAFDIDRQRVMKPYGYYMGNLPPHLVKESLNAIACGPWGSLMLACNYRLKGRVLLFEAVEAFDNPEVKMVTPWW